MIFYRGQFNAEAGLNSADGQAGFGVYCFTKNEKMAKYYTQRGEDLVSFEVDDSDIVDLTKEENALVSFIRTEMDKTAEQMGTYRKVAVNKKNYQAFGWTIQRYVNIHYPGVSGYIVKHMGPGIPTGKQVVITNLSKIKNIKIKKQAA